MLDYHVIDDADGAGRVVLAVTYRELIDRFVAACRLAKIELIGIDLEAFALLRMIAGPLPQGSRRDAAAGRRHDRQRPDDGGRLGRPGL